MRVDPVLAAEIKRHVGTSRKDRLAFVEKVDDFARDLEKAFRSYDGWKSIQLLYSEVALRYMRSEIACVLAATIANRDGMSRKATAWAQGVLEAWKPTPGQMQRALIDDNMNPTRIEEYAGGFIKATTVE